MDLGTWINQYRHDHAHDPRRRRLTEAYGEAYVLRETQPTRAVAILTEAVELAEQLDEPWWRLLCEKFRLDALMHFQRDFRDVLEPAWQLTSELKAPGFANFPEPYAVADTLLAAYLGIDAVGYAETLRSALSEWEAVVPSEPSAARYLLLARRRQFAVEQERWDDAEDWCQRELDLASHDPLAERAMHFSVFAHLAVCALAYHRGDDPILRDAAQRAADLAQRSGHSCQEAEAAAWRAVAERRAGREDVAQEALRQAAARLKHLGMPPTSGYFAALAAFYLERRQHEAAWDVLSRELATVRDRNRRLHECRIRLERCRLLTEMGRPVKEEVELALAAAAQVRYPDPFLAELGRLKKTAA
ncbi:MAG: hypothetical protein NZO58_12175 [Gemmataceae bacterium]|nr:hypothetical protein [Gemmataceae bacterium]